MAVLPACSLIPKDVEYFQKEIEPVPSFGAKENESLKQAADLAKRKAAAAEIAAIRTGADVSVQLPARDAAVLTDAVSDRIGEPLRPASDDATNKLIALLDSQEARHAAEIEKYRIEIAELVGKKIEGSGAIQVGYFTNLLLVGVILFIGYILIKALAMANPVANVLVGGVEASAHLAGKAASEVISAGEAFKTRLAAKLPEHAEAVKELFRETHERYQSADTQQLVSQATKKK